MRISGLISKTNYRPTARFLQFKAILTEILRVRTETNSDITSQKLSWSCTYYRFISALRLLY